MKQLLAIIVPATLIFSISSMLLADTTAYIPDFGNDKVHRMMAPNEIEWVERENVCGTPYGVAVSPDGAHVVVTCQEDDSVMIITKEYFEETNTDFEPKEFFLGSNN